MADALSGSGHDEVTFVGTPEGVEARLVPEAGIRFIPLPARGYDRSRPLTLLTSSFTILISTFRAWSLIRKEHPDVVVGFGGYVSLPVGFAAVLSRTPLVLHEQNSIPGLANKVLSRWARKVGVTYERSIELLGGPSKARITGNPVRAAVLAADREEARERLGIGEDETLLVVFGGSRGAKHINERMLSAAETFLEESGVRILHIAGRQDADKTREALQESAVDMDRYVAVDYMEDMGSVLAAADLLVARAGATSIAEMTAVGRAAVYIPYPYATDDHQTLNAETLEQAGAGVVMADSDLDGPGFVEVVRGLLRDPRRRATMAAASKALGRPEATGSLVALIREVAESSS